MEEKYLIPFMLIELKEEDGSKLEINYEELRNYFCIIRNNMDFVAGISNLKNSRRFNDFNEKYIKFAEENIGSFNSRYSKFNKLIKEISNDKYFIIDKAKKVVKLDISNYKDEIMKIYYNFIEKLKKVDSILE